MVLQIISWYLVIFGLGVLSAPIGLLLFKDFKDRGYFFYKVIGIINLSTLTWIISTLFHIRVNYSLAISLGILFLLFIYLLSKSRKDYDKKFFISVLIQELMFALIFSLLVFYKAYNPVIKDIEKLMDFAFLNAAIKTEYLPMIDPWFSSSTMNYYYFGHLMTALLTKISFIDAALAFNLSAVTNFAIFMTTIFSTIYFFTKKIIFSLLGLSMAALMGNISFFIDKYIEKIENVNWWGVTRIIPNTVHEVPLFSFFTCDLHPHFMSLQLVVLSIVLIYIYFAEKIRWLPYYLGILLGVIFLNNSWDILVYGVLLLLIFIYRFKDKVFSFRNIASYSKSILHVIIEGLKVLIPFLIFVLPFVISFKPGTEGIRFVDYAHTSLKEFFLVYSVQLVIAATYYLVYFIKNKNISKDNKVILLFLALALSLLCLLFNQLIALLVFIITLILFSLISSQDNGEKYIHLLVLVSFSLFLFCEIFYLKDIYGPEYQRFNTIFKLHYQAWVLNSVALPSLLYFYITEYKKRYIILLIPAFVLLVMSFFYPYYAVYKSAGEFKVNYKLDGYYHIKKNFPEDYKAINWFKQNIKKQATVLEKPGSAYSDDSMISTFTGNLTPLGWLNHEWGWRNNSAELFKLKGEINSIYRSDNETLVRNLLDKHKVQYIYFGSSELKEYLKPNSLLFDKIAKQVYSSGDVKIWEMK